MIRKLAAHKRTLRNHSLIASGKVRDMAGRRHILGVRRNQDAVFPALDPCLLSRVGKTDMDQTG